MAQMFTGHRYESDEVIKLPDTAAERFRSLAHMLQSFELDPEAHEHCKNALDELEDVYRNIVFFSQQHDPVLEVGQIWRWAVAVSTGFLRLVQARIQPALIVMAYFAAATTAIRTAWYTENWGAYTLHGIQQELEPQHRHWLDWPVEHGARHLDVLGVVLPEDDGRRPLIGF